VITIMSDSMIAERLSISPRTVEVYKARMMEKLQCRTLAEVVRAGAGLAAASAGDPGAVTDPPTL
jgi:DNA-binding NarL/FixJ family response regulator